MGTIGNQPVRQPHNGDLEGFLSFATELAKKHHTTVADVIAAKHAIELERRNSLAQDDGDYRDEQMGGIGERLESLADAVHEIAAAMRDVRRED